MSLPWENSLAVLEVLILVCSSALPRGTLSTCRSDTPILGSGHVRLYPLYTVPTRPNSYCNILLSITYGLILVKKIESNMDEKIAISWV